MRNYFPSIFCMMAGIFLNQQASKVMKEGGATLFVFGGTVGFVLIILDALERYSESKSKKVEP